jgi:hypothetical protein
MKAKPTISVITPTRNRIGFLRQAVASVVAQSLEQWELIVADDASEDGTWEYLQSLKEPRVRSLRMEVHRERSAARNAALRVARGEFVLYLDDDDWLLDRALARLIEALRAEDSAMGAVGARLTVGQDSWHREPHPRRRHVRDSWPDVLFGWAPGCGQALLKRSAVLEAGEWNERLSIAEDHDLWLRISRLGPVVLIPQAVVAVRLHPGQTVMTDARFRTIGLRRSLLASMAEKERERAARTVRAYGHRQVAVRAFGRGSYPDAWRHCFQAVRLAPWLLGSPLSRPELAGLGLRSLTGMALGKRMIRRLRDAKQAFLGALRKQRAKRTTSALPPALGSLENGGTDRRGEA